MLAQETEGHIVNTASVAGLLPYSATASCYRVTKHAVVALSEQLYYELAGREAKVKTSVLCPGYVNTQLLESGRNRPAALQNEDVEEPLSPEVEARRQALSQAVQDGMSPQTVADIVFAAIREEQFYILPNVTEAMWSSVQTRLDDLLHKRNPTLPTP
jgi:short-subunit dehydrogenase